MTASIIIYIDQIVSTVWQYPREVATAVWPWVVVGLGGLIICGVAVFEIISRIQSIKLRELQKPSVDE